MTREVRQARERIDVEVWRCEKLSSVKCEKCERFQVASLKPWNLLRRRKELWGLGSVGQSRGVDSHRRPDWAAS